MNLSGVFAPVPTPFDESDRLDTGKLRVALGQWTARPITGFIVLGSNGEAVFLSEVEADRVVVAARDAIPSDRPFIVGTGRESTQAAVAAAKRAAELGADAVLVRTPGFFKAQMTPEAFTRHYRAVADASPVPVLLYNFTALTGVNLMPPTVAELARHPNIVGMKESGGDIAQIADLVTSTPREFSVLAGTTSSFFAALCVGVAGGILAPACVVPEACARLFDLVRAGRLDDARILQRRLIPLARMLGPTYGVPGLKAALRIAGYDLGLPRPPLVPVGDTGVAALADALAQLEEISA
jgi:4-hydroxy-2-oxoglutarate aldolase